MKTVAVNGSTKLTAEQSDWYLERFGVRYTHVQWQPGVPNRKARRMARRRRAYME